MPASIQVAAATELLDGIEKAVELMNFREATGVIVKVYDPETTESTFYGPFAKDNLDVLLFIARMDEMETDVGAPLRMSVHLLFEPDRRGSG